MNHLLKFLINRFITHSFSNNVWVQNRVWGKKETYKNMFCKILI